MPEQEGRASSDLSWSKILGAVLAILLASWLGTDVVADIPSPLDFFSRTSAQQSGSDDSPAITQGAAAPATILVAATTSVATTTAPTSTTTTTEHAPSGVEPLFEFVGGCERFHVYAQGRLSSPGYGAALRVDPFLSAPRGDVDPSTPRIDGFAANTILSVNGWVATEAPYATEPDPWDSDVWFHLTNGMGWVSFAGVRAQASHPGETDGPAGGGQPVEIRPECEGDLMSVGDG